MADGEHGDHGDRDPRGEQPEDEDARGEGRAGALDGQVALERGEIAGEDGGLRLLEARSSSSRVRRPAAWWAASRSAASLRSRSPMRRAACDDMPKA